jgi:hypothetical protein
MDDALYHPVGVCDACGEADVDLYKISLGRDFFDRAYDRLSAGEDLRPKWYCGNCSREKDYQRDIRVIREEFEKLREGYPSLLSDTEIFQKALERVALIERHIKRGRKVHVLLPPGEVGILSIEMSQHASLPDPESEDL